MMNRTRVALGLLAGLLIATATSGPAHAATITTTGDVITFPSSTIPDPISSPWNIAGDLIVGDTGTGTLNIEDGGVVTSTDGSLGSNSNSTSSTGTVTVTGAGSKWNNSGNLFVGNRGGTGRLNIEDGGVVSIGGDLTISVTALGTGTLNLNDGGTLDMKGNNIVFGAGTAEFNFDGGTLLNAGEIGFDFVQDGGTLAPGNSPGVTNFTGDYTLGSAATLEIELAASDASAGTIDLINDEGIGFDFVDVTGNATLDGMLDIVLFNSFAPTTGETFDVLTAASIDTTNLKLTGAPNFTFAVIDGGNGKILQLTAVTVVPEPGSLAVAVLGFLSLGFCWRRRRRATER